MDVTGQQSRKACPVDTVDHNEVSAVMADCASICATLVLMGSMADEKEIELIEATIRDIQYSIDRLQARITEDTREVAAKRQRITVWRERLANLKGGSDESISEPRKLRRPKGANLRTIMACIDEIPGGASAGEIQRKTALAWSSVQSTLKNHPDLFIEESGLWKLRTEARLSADAVSNGMMKN